MRQSKKILAVLLSLCLLSGCAAHSGNGGGASVRTDHPRISPTPTAAPTVTDVPANVWYADAANWCLEQGLIDPDSAGAFAPNSDANRATLAAALGARRGNRPGQPDL